MTDMRSLEEQALDELVGTICACDRPKVDGHSFCRACYRALPISVQRSLYRRFADGYLQIYIEAKDFLKAEGRIA